MGHCKDSTEQDANTANDHIRNSKEGVATSHDGLGGDDDGLGTFILAGGEV
jgi:hypothetical protein